MCKRSFIGRLRRFIALIVVASLCLPHQLLFAQVVSPNLTLPSSSFVTPLLKGIKVDAKDPFKFNFVLDTGNSKLTPEQIKSEGEKLSKYFLAALAIPRKDLWVNLSPYEKNRIIPNATGSTDLGETLLAQDYLLKQLAASLTYPDTPQGKKFWAALRNIKYQI